jgi:hypothetical protein
MLRIRHAASGGPSMFLAHARLKKITPLQGVIFLSTPGGTRTHTGAILSRLPLPLGYGGFANSDRWPFTRVRVQATK